jgi:hypothetical protein
MSADDCLAAECKASKPGPKAEARQHAVAWLRTALTNAPRPAKELLSEAREAACISPQTLRRAREELGVEAYREEVPGPWYWRLPQGAQIELTSGKVLEHLEHLAGKAAIQNNLPSRGGQDAQVARASPSIGPAAAYQEVACG